MQRRRRRSDGLVPAPGRAVAAIRSAAANGCRGSRSWVGFGRLQMLNRVVLTVAVALVAGTAVAAPTVNGSIAELAESWSLLRENVNAAPIAGGAANRSDSVAESSTFHWWDGLTLTDVAFFDNRADIVNMYVAYDRDYLYLAVAGPTAPFNKFTDQSTRANNDVGDLFIAIDASGGSPSGFLKAADGHASFGGVKAVDFKGWTPTQFVGTQYVDNGNGGGGLSNF